MHTHGTRAHTEDGSTPPRRREQHRDHKMSPAQLRRRGAVLVVDGHGVSLNVERGRLVVRDGAGRARREHSFGKVTHRLVRVVVLGGSGAVGLGALHWLRDQGVPVIVLSDDRRPLCTSSVTVEDARLVRQQARAADSTLGISVARYLLAQKLRGQLAVASQLGRADVISAVEYELERLEHASEQDELLRCEREAALAYWGAWAASPIRFAPRDCERVPEHWLAFGQRHSPLTSGPRSAVNPANAVLNYLYALLEAEARIACHAVGLSPALGIVHADSRYRDSFCFDLMEAVRPQVDEFVLSLLRTRVFRAEDFYETRRGGCRILAPLTHTLAETTVNWARLLAPVCEHVARLLADAPGPRVAKPPTPLTNQNLLAARELQRRRPATRPTFAPPKPPPTCARCGGELPHRRRSLCMSCEEEFRREQRGGRASVAPVAIMRGRTGADPSHGDDAARRRAASNVSRKAAVREWEERHGKLVDLSAFTREILPLIQGVPLSRLQRATGLSLRYVSQIRRGEKTPHPRHWQLLKIAATRDSESE